MKLFVLGIIIGGGVSLINFVYLWKKYKRTKSQCNKNIAVIDIFKNLCK